ncbi:MAG: hypothetical protein ACK5ME_11055 [Parahaliea sp.]
MSNEVDMEWIRIVCPGKAFAIGKPDKWSATGMDGRPNLVHIQAPEGGVRIYLTVSLNPKSPGMTLADFADRRLSLVDQNLQVRSEVEQQDGVIFQQYYGLAEGESSEEHFIYGAYESEEIRGGFFSFTLVTSPEMFEENRSFFMRWLNSVHTA